VRKIIPELLPLAVLLTCLSACDESPPEEPRVIEFKVSGTVTSDGDGTPLEGVELSAVRFCLSCVQHQKTLASTTSGGAGMYSLHWTETQESCGNTVARLLNWKKTGYCRAEDPDPTFPIQCTSRPQRIDFSLKSVQDSTAKPPWC